MLEVISLFLLVFLQVLGSLDNFSAYLSFFFLILIEIFSMLQVENLVERMMGWLKVGGYIFFRESCFHQSGDSKRKSNPTHYREPRFYTKVCLLYYFVQDVLWRCSILFTKFMKRLSLVSIHCSCWEVIPFVQ